MRINSSYVAKRLRAIENLTLSLISLAIFALAGTSASATVYHIDTVLGDVRMYDSDNTINTSWQGSGYVVMPGITETPSCAQIGGNYVASFDTAKAGLLSVILAAKLADRTVTVTVDDAVKYPTGSYCVIQFITIK